MQKVYIHVGTHKTATTWLQHYLAKNSDKLNDVGYYYPSTGRVTQAHHRLGQAIFQRRDPKSALNGVQVWERLRKELSCTRFENILISSEEFEWVDRPELIKAFLPDVSVHAIIYLRRQDDYLESLYGQQVRDFHPRLRKTIYQYLNENNTQFLDYDKLVRRWEAASDQVTVRVFDRQFMAPGGVGNDFLAAIGILSPIDFENPTAAVIEQKSSLSLEALEFIRQCNFLELSAVKHDQLVTQTIEMNRIVSNGKTERERLLDASTRKDLMRQFCDGNRKVSARHPMASGLADLFPEIDEDALVFDQEHEVNRFDIALKANTLVSLI